MKLSFHCFLNAAETLYTNRCQYKIMPSTLSFFHSIYYQKHISWIIECTWYYLSYSVVLFYKSRLSFSILLARHSFPGDTSSKHHNHLHLHGSCYSRSFPLLCSIASQQWFAEIKPWRCRNLWLLLHQSYGHETVPVQVDSQRGPQSWTTFYGLFRKHIFDSMFFHSCLSSV